MTAVRDSEEEDRLIRLAQQGDQNAFSEIVALYQDQIYNLACRTLGDCVLAQDITQEAFVRAWRGVKNFKGQSRFSSWMYRITVNTCLSEIRRQQKPVDSLPGEELERVGSPTSRVRHFEATLESQDLIEKLIDDLPPIYRSIVVLFYIQDLDCKEIAETLGHPVGTVKAYLHRARAHLKKSADKLLSVRSCA